MGQVAAAAAPRKADLGGCDRVPWGCGVVVLVTAVLVWVGCSVDFLESASMVVGAAGSIFAFAFAVLFVDTAVDIAAVDRY